MGGVREADACRCTPMRHLWSDKRENDSMADEDAATEFVSRENDSIGGELTFAPQCMKISVPIGRTLECISADALYRATPDVGSEIPACVVVPPGSRWSPKKPKH